ncbi:MSHA biogenesis protein MshK [Thiogranum longum]|uniref:MSHA biogenesis protein MshK n=1 Tax=Thiogranum longum TaxID=1537524 RepID=A0A4R1H6T4_9GAMM|nr:general secretion pathway protein GspB [Thiogranum longum]TCK16868.1 MSHA biogenesis protein MshK [Thiogranum longum]
MARYLAVIVLGVLLANTAMAFSDPTRPADPVLYFGNGNSRGGWALQSIIFSNDRRIAIINGQRVKEGGRIGSARVARIENSHVVLKTRGRTLKLRLHPDLVKTRP